MICKMLVRKVQCRKKAFELESVYICVYLVCLHLLMTKTVPGWQKYIRGEEEGVAVPQPSSPTPAPGPA